MLLAPHPGQTPSAVVGQAWSSPSRRTTDFEVSVEANSLRCKLLQRGGKTTSQISAIVAAEGVTRRAPLVEVFRIDRLVPHLTEGGRVGDPKRRSVVGLKALD